MPRVVLHLDLDCFYAQVEARRLGVPPDVPLCVQQWQGLIAVNYAARRFGIRRHSTVDEARRLCPDVRLIHVATFAPGETEWRYHDRVSVQTHKVSLEPYRRASAAVFAVLDEFGAIVQKGGLDEAYLDVSAVVASAGTLEPPAELDVAHLGAVVGVNTDAGGRRLPEEPPSLLLTSPTADDCALVAGAQLAAEIRRAIRERLGYTISAGVAHNKPLAKICSALNKPDSQTVLPSVAVPALLAVTPLRKIPMLGGKFGSAVAEAFGAATCADVLPHSAAELGARFGEDAGQWLWRSVRGLSDDAVTPRGPEPKGMMAAKSFGAPLRTAEAVRSWVGVLAAELFGRLQTAYEDDGRWPKTLTLVSRATGHSQRSRSAPVPPPRAVATAAALASLAAALLPRPPASGLPCARLQLSVTGVSAVIDRTGGAAAFQRFLSGPRSSGGTEGSLDTLSRVTESADSATFAVSADLPKEPELPRRLCEKCKRQVPEVEWTSHADWHVALALADDQQRELDESRQVSASAAGGCAPRSRSGKSAPMAGPLCRFFTAKADPSATKR